MQELVDAKVDLIEQMMNNKLKTVGKVIDTSSRFTEKNSKYYTKAS
jgi:hypothetical protein